MLEIVRVDEKFFYKLKPAVLDEERHSCQELGHEYSN